MNTNPLIPEVITQLADFIFDESFLNEKIATKHDFYQFFSRGFFAGLLEPDKKIQERHDARILGFLAGQNYRKHNPDKFEEIMLDFGYRYVDTEGRWVLGFESSDFYPHTTNPSSAERDCWWLVDLCKFEPGMSIGNYFSEGLRIHVRGFLNPRGLYGHLGRCSHQLFAIAISNIPPPRGGKSRGEGKPSVL